MHLSLSGCTSPPLMHLALFTFHTHAPFTFQTHAASTIHTHAPSTIHTYLNFTTHPHTHTPFHTVEKMNSGENYAEMIAKLEEEKAELTVHLNPYCTGPVSQIIMSISHNFTSFLLHFHFFLLYNY